MIGNRANGQFPRNGVIGNFTELAENPTLRELQRRVLTTAGIANGLACVPG
jgi:hypothetical protein